MKDRPFESLTWENPWGKLTIEGRRLAIYDESVLLAVLVLMRKYKRETFETTRHELCRIMGVTPQPNTYRAITETLDRLTGSKVRLEVRGKRKIQLFHTMLSGGRIDEESGKILITVNPYFVSIYGKGLLTNLDLEFRAGLKGDVAKALYRFYEGQREKDYSCHLLTLAKAINLDLDMPTFRVRARIREGLRVLRKAKYFKRWQISKSDVVKVWR